MSKQDYNGIARMIVKWLVNVLQNELDKGRSVANVLPPHTSWITKVERSRRGAEYILQMPKVSTDRYVNQTVAPPHTLYRYNHRKEK